MAIPFHLPPKGRVTLVVADVRFGALLAERDPETTATSTEMLEEYLRRVLEDMGGHEVRTEGYAFLTVWPSTIEAVRWCLRVQVGLLDLPWPQALLDQAEAGVVCGPAGALLHRGLRVRMGVHVGSPLVRQDDRLRTTKYFGPPVSHVARVAGAALGGQVLLTGPAYAEVVGQLDGEAAVRNLGSFRLRGRRGAVELIEVAPRTLASRDFPPLRTVDVRRTNLMPDREHFVGRRADIEALHELFDLGVRLVTISGPSGMGKSRLADRYCLDSLEEWRQRGGVWVCDVSGATTLDGLLREVAAALDLPLTLGRNADESIAQIGHAVAAMPPVLLCLDGMDGVAHWATRTLLEWLRAAPNARWLVSCRTPFGVPGEVAYELGALSLPDQDDSETLRLFYDVAQHVSPGWRMLGQDVAQVHELVRAVGGTPLGIRLVASQINKFSPNEMLAGVVQRAQAYDPGRVSDAEDGLIAATEFAWDQLAFWERDAISQCAVFAGGFDLEAAEQVLDLSEHMSAPWIGDVLHVLVDRAILRRIEAPEAPGTPRHTLHARIAEHARRRLPDAQKVAAEARHANHYLQLCEGWARTANQRGGGEAMARLALELDNLLVVHERALAHQPLNDDSVNYALRVALAVEPLLAAWGPVSTLMRVLDAAIHAANALQRGDTNLRARALAARARAHRHQERLVDALVDCEQALGVVARDAAPAQCCCLRTVYGDVLRRLGRFDDAGEQLEVAIVLGRDGGDARLEGLALGALADLCMATGRLQRALQLYRESVGRLRHVGDARSEGLYTGRLALLYRRMGQAQRAGELFQDALLAHRQTGNRRMEGVVLGHMGTLDYHRGDLERAQEKYDRAQRIARAVGDRATEARMIAARVIASVEQNDLDHAARLVDEAAELSESAGDVSGEARAIAYSAFVAHFAGSLDDAAAAYQRASLLLVELPDRRFYGSLLGWEGALMAERGDVDAARRCFEQATEVLTSAADERLLRALSVLRVSLEIVEGGDVNRLRERLRVLVREGDAVADVRVAALRVNELLDRKRSTLNPLPPADT